MRTRTILGMALASAAALIPSLSDGANRWGLQPGTVELKSAGPLAFGPDGILLIGDPQAAVVIAVNTEDTTKPATPPTYQLDTLDERLKKALDASEVTVQDMAVNPVSGNVYLSVTAKRADQSSAVIARVTPSGEVKALSLTKVESAKVALPNAPEDKVVNTGRRPMNPRLESVTDIAYADGRVLVSGLSNGPSRSNVWEIPLPFGDVGSGTPIEIYHGAHGAVESHAAVKTFIPMTIDGQPSILAGYTCTPLVRFSLEDLKGDSKVRGTTVAELGNMNQPLDIIQYKKDGKDFLLMANSKRGVMKISTENLGRNEGISERVGGGGTAGQEFQTIGELQGVVQLDRLSDTQAVLLVSKDSQSYALRTVELP